MDKSMHGGKREGAGRPPCANPRKSRPLKANDEEWKIIKDFAALEGISVNEYIVKAALKQVES